MAAARANGAAEKTKETWREKQRQQMMPVQQAQRATTRRRQHQREARIELVSQHHWSWKMRSMQQPQELQRQS